MNLAFSPYLLGKNKTWAAFSLGRLDTFWAILMGIWWMGAFALYGVGAAYLGPFGSSIGWGLFQISMILTTTPGY